MKKILTVALSIILTSNTSAMENQIQITDLFGALKGIAGKIDETLKNANKINTTATEDASNNNRKEVEFEDIDKKEIIITKYGRYYYSDNSYYGSNNNASNLGIAVIDRVSSSGIKTFIGPNDQTVFTTAWKLKKENIVQVNGGQTYTIILTSDGNVYATGSGQDLFTSTTTRTPEYEKINGLSNIKRISSNLLGTHIAIDIFGQAYVWGSRVMSYSGVRYNDYKSRESAVKIDSNIRFKDVKSLINGFIFIGEDQNAYVASQEGMGMDASISYIKVDIGNEKVSEIATDHSSLNNVNFIVSTNGNVYAFNRSTQSSSAFGNNKFGDGIRNQTAYASQPKPIPDLKGCKNFTFALSDVFAICNNRIYAWGDNRSGIPTKTRMGIIDAIPSEVNIQADVSEIQGNDEILLIKTMDRKLKFFGRDYNSETKQNLNIYNKKIYPANFIIPKLEEFN